MEETSSGSSTKAPHQESPQSNTPPPKIPSFIATEVVVPTTQDQVQAILPTSGVQFEVFANLIKEKLISQDQRLNTIPRRVPLPEGQLQSKTWFREGYEAPVPPSRREMEKRSRKEPKDRRTEGEGQEKERNGVRHERDIEEREEGDRHKRQMEIDDRYDPNEEGWIGQYDQEREQRARRESSKDRGR